MKFRIKNWREWTDVAFHGVTAISAAVVAGIAIWGAFFTDLPEALVRQLRSDVAETKEELTDLRRQQRHLNFQLSEARKALHVAEDQRDKVKSQIVSLSQEKKEMERKIASLARDRKSYFENVKRIALDRFFSAVRNSLNDLSFKTNMARTYGAFLKWNSKTDRKRAVGEFNLLAFKDENRAEISTAWLNLKLHRYLRGENRTEQELISDFKERVTLQKGKRLPDGKQVVLKHLDDETFQLFLATDRRAIKNQIRSFLKRHDDDFSKPLAVALPPGWTPKTLKEAAIQILRNHDRVAARIKELQKKITPKK